MQVQAFKNTQRSLVQNQKDADGQKTLMHPNNPIFALQKKEDMGKTVQKMGMEEEEEEAVQAKLNPLQMQEEEEEEAMMLKMNPVQKKDKHPAPSNLSTEVSKSLPADIKQKAENVLGEDVSGVQIKESPAATSIGALAYAQGNEITFAPGEFQPHSQKGQELIGHELAHIQQQRQGRVQATKQSKGAPVNDDPSLEQEADQMGEKIAQNDFFLSKK